MTAALTDLARRVSNWGRWGVDDERGTVNFITPDVVQRAARCVRRGRTFSLGLDFSADGPQFGQAGRVNPLHIMTSTSNQMTPDPAGLRYADDVNGSRDRVAGVANEEGNVLGLMPHPEHAIDSLLGPTGGRPLLEGLVARAREQAAVVGA